MRLRNVIVKLHIYAGLLTFTQLMIFGIAGLVATVQNEPTRTVTSTRDIPFTPAASATDKEVADEVYRTLALPLTRPIPAWAIKRNAENDLQLDFYTMNGIWRAVVFEPEHRIRLEAIPNDTWRFLGIVHASTSGDREAPRLVYAWALYNEFAMWCLLAFCLSGVYLWLSAQLRVWWAWGCLAVGIVSFVAVWSAFR
jgi:uncharacterized iron-regulated membrane protein